MNIKEIAPGTEGTLARYLEVTAPFIFLTIWILIAYRSKHLLGFRRTPLWMQIMAPVIIPVRALSDLFARTAGHHEFSMV